HFEAVVLHGGDDGAHGLEHAVGEDVAVDERARPVPLPGGRTGDAVVEQPAAVSQPSREEPEVTRQIAGADMLGETDRGHGVETGLADVPVVVVPYLRAVGQATPPQFLLGPFGLRPGQRHAHGSYSVVLYGMRHHVTPTTADV